jgi:RimJ/RimL family protein N-acetyltransferase
MKPLTTARLHLRPFTWADFAETHRLLYADPAVAPGWTGRVKTLEEIRPSFAAKVVQRAGDLSFLALLHRADEQLLGTIALQRYAPDDDTSYMRLADAPEYRVGSDPAVIEAELTYALGRAYWGQGYATEAAWAVLAYGFQELGVARIVNDVSSANTASLDLTRRLGFQLCANLNPHSFGPDAPPGIIGTLTRAEWAQLAEQS